jgi:hypothetical protein
MVALASDPLAASNERHDNHRFAGLALVHPLKDQPRTPYQ